VTSAAATIEDFERLDIRAGTIRSAAPLDGARKPATRLAIDFGPELGERRSSAQITERYAPGDLVGLQVMAVVNLPPRRVAGFDSEVLVLGFPDEAGRIVLARPAAPVPDGARLV
jgi:tRNA-binding protein